MAKATKAAIDATVNATQASIGQSTSEPILAVLGGLGGIADNHRKQILRVKKIIADFVNLSESNKMDKKQYAIHYARMAELQHIAEGGDTREAVELRANKAGIIEAVKYKYIAEPLTMDGMAQGLCSFISKAGQVAELKAKQYRLEKDTADAEVKADVVLFYKQQCDSSIETVNNLGQGSFSTIALAVNCILLGGFMQLMELESVLTKEQLERQLLASMTGLLAGQQEHGAKIDGIAATMEAKRASELRAGLGYTRADLLILLDVLGLPEDRAGKLPPFPLPADYKSRKRIYEFTNSASMYAPLFAWCRSHEITAGHDGKTTAELYADDPAAKGRHWKLANAQEQLYNAIRANEAFIASETPLYMTLANSEKASFYELLAELGKTVTSGQWGETPPPDVLGIIPRDPLADVAAKLADHDARTREQGATINDVRDRLPPVLAKAEEAERGEVNTVRAFLRAMTEWELTERQKKIFALRYKGMTIKAIGKDKEVKLKERQVYNALAEIKAVFLKETGKYPIPSGESASREKVAEGADWTGDVTRPDDPDDLDDGDRDE